MRIIFICSSLMPGKDGVGDYTLKLSSELVRNGHECILISVNERIHFAEPGKSPEAIGSLLVLRLGSNFSWKTRFALIRNFIQTKNADLISLQYVPYGFSKKGLPFMFTYYFKKLVKGIPAHVMFHELAVGRDSYRWSHRHLIRPIQLRLIRSLLMVETLWLVHTHLPLYFKQLARLGAPVKPLALISNIECLPLCRTDPFAINKFRVVLFGQVGANHSVREQLNNIVKFFSNTSIEVTLYIISSDIRVLTLSGQYYSCIKGLGKTLIRYYLPESEISKILSQSHLALTPNPRHALGKSGSVAAFLAAGLPVLAPSVLVGYPEDDLGFFHEEVKSRILYAWNYDSWSAIYNSDYTASTIMSVGLLADTFLSDIKSTKKTFCL